MTQNQLASLLHGVLADLREPDLVWQLPVSYTHLTLPTSDLV